MQRKNKLTIDCNSDCIHTSLEAGECQKRYVTLIWTEREDNGRKSYCVVCDDYKPYQLSKEEREE